MKRLTALLLLLILIISNLTALTSCRDDEDDYYDYEAGTPGTSGGTEGGDDGDDDEEIVEQIIVPPYKDYGRDTLNFADITYSRPDIAAIVLKLGDISELVDSGTAEYTEMLDALNGILNDYNDVITMYSYANIMTSRDSSDTVWADEYSYISTSYPDFVQALEGIFVSCAKSEYKTSFEEDFFGTSSLDEYVDGGDYTDEIVALMKSEAELEAEYLVFSTANVTITIGSVTDTADYFISYYYDLYGKSEYTQVKYQEALILVYNAYNKAVTELSKPLYVELVKIRRKIADEFGYESYATFAYDTIYHDYEIEDAKKFIYDIATYIIPLYRALITDSFRYYTAPESIKTLKLHENTVINTLYKLYEKNDAELHDIYSYMLQHSLYDIAPESDNRYGGAFTAYLDKYNAPYVFVTTGGTLSDYSTLSHEFGHFADNFINYGEDSSLDLTEVYSQSLELLTLTMLEDELSEDHAEYLKILMIDDMLMNTFIAQGFYALFEHKVYELPYSEISVARLSEIAAECAETFSLNLNSTNALDAVIIQHTVLYPFYVQSYCTSAAVSFDIYFKERETDGAGLTAYKALIDRTDTYLTFLEYISDAGITDPFSDGYLRDLAGKIYEDITHKKYYPEYDDDANVA